MFPAAIVKGQTNTTDSHERLLSIGVGPRVKADASPMTASLLSSSAHLRGATVRRRGQGGAPDLWDGTGGFVFTSSTAVYNGTDGEPCDEKTPEFKMGENPRADRLLEAEAGVLAANGCVVRLSGLYHSSEAHTCISSGSHAELQRGRARKPRALRGRGGGAWWTRSSRSWMADRGRGGVPRHRRRSNHAKGNGRDLPGVFGVRGE